MAITINGIVTHKGLVLSKGESYFNDGYDTSYYAIVWDFETMQTKIVCYDSTMARPEEKGTCEIDAIPLVQECYNVYKHNLEVKRNILNLQNETIYQPKVGFTVKVARGRLIPKGTILTITKTYDTNYGMKFIGIDSNGIEYKSYIKNLEVIAVPVSFKAANTQYKQYPTNNNELASGLYSE